MLRLLYSKPIHIAYTSLRYRKRNSQILDIIKMNLQELSSPSLELVIAENTAHKIHRFHSSGSEFKI